VLEEIKRMDWKFWGVRAGIVLGIMLAGALVLLGIQKLIGHPEEAAQLSYSYGDWRMDCGPPDDAKGGCALTENLFAKSGETIAHIVYVEGDHERLEIVVPHGVLLQPGMGFSVGKDAVKAYPYETCDAAGCLAFVPVDDAMRAALLANGDGQIVLMPPQGKPIGFKYSLKGFSDGVKALESDRNRRTAWWRFLVS